MINGAEQRRVASLTARQQDILELVARGLTNGEIGSTLGISATTVRTHITAILRALEVTNRTEAALVAERAASSTWRIEWLFRHPAIHVLPFRTPPTSDPTAETVAFGLTEDLIDRFSRRAWFPVVRGTTARQPSDARYRVDGSVRSEADSLRVVVAVEDSETGERLYTDTMDIRQDAVLQARDALVDRIVGAAYPALLRVSGRRAAKRVHEPDVRTWELTHAGMALLERANAEDNAKALALFEDAHARDPHDMLSSYGCGLASYFGLLNQWIDRDQACARLLSAAERCLAMNCRSEHGHFLMARWHMANGDFAQAIPPLRQAVAMNPSFGIGHSVLGQCLLLCGDFEGGEQRMRYAVRLGPHAYVAGLAVARFCRQDYQGALEAADEVLLERPHYAFALLMAAVSAWWAKDATASARIARLHELHPDFSIQRFLDAFGAGGAEPVKRVERAYLEATG